MNKELESFARERLIYSLNRCTYCSRYIFNRMYSPKNRFNPIEDTVAKMSVNKLDWAMQQVKRTLDNDDCI